MFVMTMSITTLIIALSLTPKVDFKFHSPIFRRVHKIATSDYYVRYMSVCLSVLPNGTTWLQLGKFFYDIWHFKDISKIS